MTAPGFRRRIRELHERGGRLVVVDPRRSEPAALAAEHLLHLGHRDLGVIGGDLDPIAFEVPERRLRGFREQCQRYGVDVAAERIVGGGFRLDGGYAAMAVLLEHDPPTAVFAMSDEMAFGALMALQERGLTPGVDVSVIGVDDHARRRTHDDSPERGRQRRGRCPRLAGGDSRPAHDDRRCRAGRG